ncbi:MAG: PEFG-CTERM sorting domain-containing protein, partial [Nitrosopumilus sp.]
MTTQTKVMFPLVAIFATAIMMSVPPAFTDHAEVTITTVEGSSAQGCEETANGCYIPSIATVDVGGKVI